MANDFSSTPSCKALWRFESGALNADSKGANTLTAVNTPTEDTTIKKEGGCAAVLASASDQFFKIADADLDAGFPMKTGDTTKQISICGWVRMTTVGVCGLIGKVKYTKDQYCIGFSLSSAGHLIIQWGTDSIDTGFALNGTRWYHVALVADCLNKLLYVRWYDDYTGSVYFFSPPPGRITAEVTPGSLEFRIGAENDSDTSYTFNGRVDEIVVFAGLLGPDDIDKIRAATFASITDEAIVLALDAQALYLGDIQANVYGLQAQVLYDTIPRYTGGLTVAATPNSNYFQDPKFYTGGLSVSLTPNSAYIESWAYTGDISLSLTPTSELIHTIFYDGDVPVALTPQSLFNYDAPSVKSYNGDIGIAITPNSDSWWDKACVGNIIVSLSPTCETIWGRTFVGGLIVSPVPNSTYFDYPPIEYAGDITLALSLTSTYYKYQLPTALGSIIVTLTPTSKWMIPIIGQDSNTGYGLIDLTALQEDPPYFCAVQEIPINLDATAAAIEPYRELNVLGAGGVGISGAGVVVWLTPQTEAVLAEGGVEISGIGLVSFALPKIRSIIAAGGLMLSGKGVVAWVTPSAAAADKNVIASGEVKVSGVGVFEVTRPETYAVVGQGGLQVGLFRSAPATITVPEDLIVSPSAGPVALEMGGEGSVLQSKPGFYEVPGVPAGQDAALKVGGAGTTTFIHPVIWEAIAEGGVLLGSEPEIEEGVFETWVLSGKAYEPSIYSGFNFNSFALYRGHSYGAAADGLYLLEGPDDAGETIHTGVRIGPVNFGTDRQKRLRSLRLGGNNNGAKVRVATESGEEGYFDVVEGRVAVSRNLEDREFIIDVADFDQLSQVDIVPLVLARR